MRGGARGILVEKPFVLTLEEAERVEKSAREANVCICVTHSMLFQPVIRGMFTAVRQAAVGEVFSVHVQMVGSVKNDGMINDPQHWSHRLPGGRLEEGLPHAVYLLHAFLGLDAEVVAVVPDKRSGLEWVGHDTLMGLVRTKRGSGTFLITSASGQESITVDVVGSRGIMRGYVVENYLETSYPSIPHGSRYAVERARAVIGQIGSRAGALILNGLKVATGNWPSPNGEIMKLFLSALQNGTPPPVTLEEALATVRLTHEIVDRALSAAGER